MLVASAGVGLDTHPGITIGAAEETIVGESKQNPQFHS